MHCSDSQTGVRTHNTIEFNRVRVLVPRHTGITGNEHTDRLNGIAIAGNGRALDRGDILNVTRVAGREEDVSKDCEFETLNSLLHEQ